MPLKWDILKKTIYKNTIQSNHILKKTSFTNSEFELNLLKPRFFSGLNTKSGFPLN